MSPQTHSPNELFEFQQCLVASCVDPPVTAYCTVLDLMVMFRCSFQQLFDFQFLFSSGVDPTESRFFGIV